jgi:hypothetical protein
MAKPFHEIGIENSKVLRRLIRLGIIKSAGHKIYYLDETRLLNYRLNRSKWGFIVLFLFLAIIALIYMTGQ